LIQCSLELFFSMLNKFSAHQDLRSMFSGLSSGEHFVANSSSVGLSWSDFTTIFSPLLKISTAALLRLFFNTYFSRIFIYKLYIVNHNLQLCLKYCKELLYWCVNWKWGMTLYKDNK